MALTILLVVGLVPGVAGAGGALFTGSIQAGHPGTFHGAGVTEQAAGCDPQGAANGVDGTWFDVSAYGDGTHGFELTMDTELDADAFFFDSSCSFLATLQGARNLASQPERGLLPQGASFALVTGFLGQGTFTLEIVEDPSFPTASGPTAGYAPIQPGAYFAPAGGGHCTLNFVFEDTTGNLFIGAAAHCVGAAGQSVRAPDIGVFGTIVYRSLERTDFALIDIDASMEHLVDPALRIWGGPTGVQDSAQIGQPLLHYGQGDPFGRSETTRPGIGAHQSTKEADFWGDRQGWWTGVMRTAPGDSGGPVLTADGKALGTSNAIAPQDLAAITGPTLKLILEQLDGAGFDVSLVTAPFDVADLPEKLSQATDQCTAEPAAKADSGDACVTPYDESPVVSARKTLG